MKILALIILLTFAGCSTPVATPESKLKRDLIGHTTGAGPAAWHFRKGQIKQVRIISNSGDRVEAALVLQSSETKEKFFAIVRAEYFYCLTNCHERVESVGLIYISKMP